MPTEFLPGEWYITVMCSNCNQSIPLFYDMSQGKSPVVGGYTLDCPKCLHKATYEGEEVEHYQHPCD